jgi:hypothetical protein
VVAQLPLQELLANTLRRARGFVNGNFRGSLFFSRFVPCRRTVASAVFASGGTTLLQTADSASASAGNNEEPWQRHR